MTDKVIKSIYDDTYSVINDNSFTFNERESCGDCANCKSQCEYGEHISAVRYSRIISMGDWGLMSPEFQNEIDELVNLIMDRDSPLKELKSLEEK